MNKQLLLYCFLCQCYRFYMDVDTTRGTGASRGNVVSFKRFNEAWLEQLFILLKVIFYKEYFEWGQIIIFIIIIIKLGILVGSRVKTSKQEQGDMYLKCGILFKPSGHLMVIEPKDNCGPCFRFWRDSHSSIMSYLYRQKKYSVNKIYFCYFFFSDTVHVHIFSNTPCFQRCHGHHSISLLGGLLHMQ